MDTKQISCQNCEKPFDEGFSFCPNCGQKTNEELTLGVLFYNTISNYFSFDARFLKSFFPLMFRPGYLAKRFLEGKRLLYLHPAQMYLFVSVILFFLFSFTVNKWIKEADTVNEKITSSEDFSLIDETALDSIMNKTLEKSIPIENDSLSLDKQEAKAVVDSLLTNAKKNGGAAKINLGITKKRLDSLRGAGLSENEIYLDMGMDEDAGFISRGFYRTLVDIADGYGFGLIIKRFADTVPIAMFFLLPIFALILKIFYFRRGSYAHHLVFSFYFFSFLFTVFSILLAINMIYPKFPALINWLIVLSTFVYFYLALIHFFKRNWFFTFIKSCIITFTFLLFVLPLAFVIIGFVAAVNS